MGDSDLVYVIQPSDICAMFEKQLYSIFDRRSEADNTSY